VLVSTAPLLQRATEGLGRMRLPARPCPSAWPFQGPVSPHHNPLEHASGKRERLARGIVVATGDIVATPDAIGSAPGRRSSDITRLRRAKNFCLSTASVI